MAGAGPLSPAELAAPTDTNERFIREWLLAQAAAGLVTYDAVSECFTLPAEQALALTNEDTPASVIGAYQVAQAAIRNVAALTECFRTGEGFGWHEHSSDLFEGTERFFRPGYLASLTSAWLPALDGVVEKLQLSARVAGIGCGHGATTILMAQAHPNSQFEGFDYRSPSNEAARQRAAAAGLGERVRLSIASAQQYPGADYDLVCTFDCLHDMGDPAGAAAHVRRSLKPDGSWLLMEPFTNDAVAANLNPIGALFYSISTLVYTPASLAQEVGLALGNQATDAQLRAVVIAGGFRSFMRVTETPINRVFEAKP